MSTTCIFNQSMLKGVCDIFATVVNFISSDSEEKHVTIWPMWNDRHNWHSHVSKITKVFLSSMLKLKNSCLCEDERSNLQTCANALNFIVSCSNLGFLESFDGSCFGHALSKLCHYATTYGKMFISPNYESTKVVQWHSTWGGHSYILGSI